MRTKLADRSLPYYTPSEESFNEISHIVGAGMSGIGMIACIALAMKEHSNTALAASLIYGISNILLYTMSSIYHGLRPGMAKKVFQILDHCTIYLMIAGTYTPIILCSIAPTNPREAVILMAVEWGVAAFSIVLNAIDLKEYRIYAQAAYLVMGWAVIPMWRTIVATLTWNGLLYLLAGGVIYSIGAILYAVGSKKSYMHCIFHVCVLIGSIFHFIAIFQYVL